MFKAVASWSLRVGAALAVALVLAGLQPVAAQQQPAKADDKLLLQYLQGKPPSNVEGRISIPDAKAATLIQPDGRSWQQTQNTVKTVGAIAILGMVGVLILFYFGRGKIMIDAGPSTARIERFNGIERFAHWLTASSFIVLGLTGINLIWGRGLLLPILGPETFTLISDWGKVAHNYLSFAFCAGVVMMVVLWVRHNVPNDADVEWLKQGGGLLKKGVHPPSEKFNAGQKVIFWSVVLGGLALAITGYILMFPFYWTDMAGMQLAQVIHAFVSVILVAVILAHIYIGSVGMEGAFDAMYTGQVDANWAKEHHNRWAARVTGQPGHAD